MLHVDNAYWLPHVEIRGRVCFTNISPATAFRGFGGPKGVLAIECVMSAVAAKLGMDPLDVRKANLYGRHGSVTPYGMGVESSATGRTVIETLEQTADYRARRSAIAALNERSSILRKGLALTPIKFGIAFTISHLNQAGALVHVYTDGSVHLNHGGTEMGQGLFIKVAQVVADEFGLPASAVKVSATRTDKVPNTAPTAASAGSDLNGMAARNAALAIKTRLAALMAQKAGCQAEDVVFAEGLVQAKPKQGEAISMTFAELAHEAYLARISLSATGHYKTPKLNWDRSRGTGRPFHYFVWGAACSEVVLDTMTGEMRVTRVDILHDVGHSLNPAIDRGQIEGGFVQGMGWLTTEELVFDRHGRLHTHAPSTYKIPVASDVPEDFRVTLYQEPNEEQTIYRSKAVGEPPLMLASSVFCAIVDAIQSLSPLQQVILDAPATPEAVLRSIEHLTGGAGL